MHPAQTDIRRIRLSFRWNLSEDLCSIFNLISFSIITEDSAGDPFQMFSHISSSLILCLTPWCLLFWRSPLPHHLPHLPSCGYSPLDLSILTFPYQLIISGVDTVQDHFYIGGFQIDHTHLSGQVVGCLVTQQRLIHIVCQKCQCLLLPNPSRLVLESSLILYGSLEYPIFQVLFPRPRMKYRRHKAWCSCC